MAADLEIFKQQGQKIKNLKIFVNCVHNCFGIFKILCFSTMIFMPILGVLQFLKSDQNLLKNW